MIAFDWKYLGYITELILSALVVIWPIQKKNNWQLKACFGAMLLTLFFYSLASVLLDNLEGVIMFIYWLSYIIAIYFYIGFLTKQSIIQIIYSTAIASCLQHISSCIYFSFSLYFNQHYQPLQFLICIMVNFIGYFLVTKEIAQEGQFIVRKLSVIPVLTIVFIVNILVLIPNLSPKLFGVSDGFKILFYILDITCCVYILWGQVNHRQMLQLQKELHGMESIWQRQKHQFKITRETIDIINRKSHDLKHQLHLLKETDDQAIRENYFNEINEAIMIYDTNLNTGNIALDTVLMEKGLYCQANNIQWTCMIQGNYLNFMKAEDIYALFGNAVDNAIQAVLNLKEIEKRIINVRMVIQKQLLVIQFSNYYEGNLEFNNDLPITIKENKDIHGFGMKSILYTAEKYNGTMTISTENQMFMLQVLLPINK